MKKVLLKDIIIPAGTVLTESAICTQRMGQGHFSATIGLSKNTSGAFEYCIEDDPEIMAEYFTDLKE